MVRYGSRNIEGWITIKEADWFEHEADIASGHDGPVFRARDVMRDHCVPDDYVSILDGAHGT